MTKHAINALLNLLARFADNFNMENFSALLPLFKAVLTDWRVIGTAVVIFLMMNFGNFVANYVKKPKPVRRRKVVATKPAATNEAASQEDEDEESDSAQEAVSNSAR